MIIEQILNRLTSSYSNSRRVLNVLNCIEFLLKNGSSKFKGEIEDEKFFLQKLKENFNDSYDELHKPIQNNIDKIIELLGNEELMKKEREQAKSVRERFKGISSETNKYEAYSSDDIQTQGSYDSHKEVNLSKKLGLNLQPKQEPENNPAPTPPQTNAPVQENQFIDFLQDEVVQAPPQIQQAPKTEPSKKKGFLPPPPKKQDGQIRYHKKKEEGFGSGEDLLGQPQKSPLPQQKGDNNIIELVFDEGKRDNNHNQVFEPFDFNSLDHNPPKSTPQQDLQLLDLTENTHK